MLKNLPGFFKQQDTEPVGPKWGPAGFFYRNGKFLSLGAGNPEQGLAGLSCSGERSFWTACPTAFCMLLEEKEHGYEGGKEHGC